MTNNLGLTVSVGDTTPRFTTSIDNYIIRIGDSKYCGQHGVASGCQSIYAAHIHLSFLFLYTMMMVLKLLPFATCMQRLALDNLSPCLCFQGALKDTLYFISSPLQNIKVQILSHKFIVWVNSVSVCQYVDSFLIYNFLFMDRFFLKGH